MGVKASLPVVRTNRHGDGERESHEGLRRLAECLDIRADLAWLEARWLSLPMECPREFCASRSRVCLRAPWCRRTRLLNAFDVLTHKLEQEPGLAARMGGKHGYSSTAKSVVRRAYPNAAGGPGSVLDVVSEIPILDQLKRLRKSLEGNDRKVQLLHLALLLLLDLPAEDLVSTLADVCERVQRCSSAQRQAFALLVLRAAETMSATGRTPGATHATHASHGPEWALRRAYEILEAYIDEHKLRAFESSCTQPARLYFTAVGDRWGERDMDVHGVSWYVEVVARGGLGMAMPILIDVDDSQAKAFCDHWAALKPSAWEAFKAPDSFGAHFTAVARKARCSPADFVQRSVKQGELPAGYRPGPPRSHGAFETPGRRRALAVHVHRLSHFFTREVFVRLCLETLNAETRPEYVGWRAASEALYRAFRVAHLGAQAGAPPPETLVEYLYNDEYFTEFSTVNGARFLAWLGVIY